MSFVSLVAFLMVLCCNGTMQSVRNPFVYIKIVLAICACLTIATSFAARLPCHVATHASRRRSRPETHEHSTINLVDVPGFAVIHNLSYENNTFPVDVDPENAAHVEQQLAQTINIEPGASFVVQTKANATFLSSTFVPGTTWLFYDTQGQFMAHYYHFLEYVLGLWAVDALSVESKAKRSTVRVANVLMGPFLSQSQWRKQEQQDLNALMLSTLFHGVVVWDADNRLPSTERFTFERVVIADRWGAHRDNRVAFSNKMDYGVLNWAFERNPSVFEPLKRRFVQAVCPECADGADAANPVAVKSTDGQNVNATLAKPRLTYISRQLHARRLDSYVASALETMLITELTPFYSVDIVYMQDLSAFDQIRQAAFSNVMLAVHGNGLSHAMWMPRGGAVVEMFPNRRCLRDYYMLATVAGHAWVGIDNDTVVVPGQGTFCQEVPTGNDDNVIVVDVDLVKNVLLTLRSTLGKRVLV